MSTKSLLSDAQVLKDSESQPWMFGILVDRYQGAFLRKGRSILHSHDVAEDAVQDTFIKNTCYTYASRQARGSSRVMTVDFVDLDALGGPNTPYDKEQLSFVQSVLARLPDNLSRLLSLYFFEDKSYEEIAEIEHLSLSAVRSGIHRAKKQFRILALQMA